jgi:hypothetical protein
VARRGTSQRVRHPAVASRAPANVGPGWRARAPALQRCATPRRRRFGAEGRASAAITETRGTIDVRGSSPPSAAVRRGSPPFGTLRLPLRFAAVRDRPRSPLLGPEPTLDALRRAAGARAPSPAEPDRLRAAPCRNERPRRASRVRRRMSSHVASASWHVAARPASRRRVARARQRRSGLAGEGARAPAMRDASPTSVRGRGTRFDSDRGNPRNHRRPRIIPPSAAVRRGSPPFGTLRLPPQFAAVRAPPPSAAVRRRPRLSALAAPRPRTDPRRAAARRRSAGAIARRTRPTSSRAVSKRKAAARVEGAS